MPTIFPIARAVGSWSPVIMITSIPAVWQSSMLCGTVLLGGSKIPQRPRKASGPGSTSSCRRSSAPSAFPSCSAWLEVRGRTAMSRLLRPCLARSWFSSSMSSFSSDVMPASATSRPPLLAAPRLSTAWMLGRMRSGAPLRMAKCVCSSPKFSAARLRPDVIRCTVALILRFEVKGTSSLGSRRWSLSSCMPASLSSRKCPFIEATLRAASLMLPSATHSPPPRFRILHPWHPRNAAASEVRACAPKATALPLHRAGSVKSVSPFTKLGLTPSSSSLRLSDVSSEFG
mmetsp:Transcript_13762/g.24852  ORF Transcript_13762/g.24852 Transcript_13762/m.24852 type:complete len:287 (+) Transcript_13762:281-1141(+)